MIEILTNGLNFPDLGLLALRVVPGVFFLTFRFRWVFDPAQGWFCDFRRRKLIERMCSCGYGSNAYMAALVAIIEIGAGAALIVGLLAVPAALGILVIMMFAQCCEPPEELRKMQIADKIDLVAKFLLFCEPLYFTMAAATVLMGPGRWSLDWLIFGR